MHNYSGHLFNFGCETFRCIIKTYVVKALYTRVFFICVFYIFLICIYNLFIRGKNQ